VVQNIWNLIGLFSGFLREKLLSNSSKICQLFSGHQFLRCHPFTFFQAARGSHDHFYLTLPWAMEGDHLKGKNHPFKVKGGEPSGPENDNAICAVAITTEKWGLAVHGH
jgi:hypothetical protein